MSGPTSGAPEPDWKRKQRLAAIFGDSLPEITSDEKDDAAPASAGEPTSEKWLKEQVPPHHG